ncbi:hypothetical protein D1P53_000968 [Cryptococcus gattii VGV]|nr:hypothetical protein D1P53_000968 [Cryptococcus gattii VGV]
MGDHPPSYTPTLPQILVLPLPDATSWFQQACVQGEVFVKGLGSGAGAGAATGGDTLYPPPPAIHSDSGTEQQLGASRPPLPFPTSQTFSIPLPERIPLPSWAHQRGGGDALLPGTLNLTAYNKGQIRYSLTVRLVLSSGQIISHSIPIEGTPQVQVHHEPAQGDEKDEVEQVEQVLTKKGVMTRLVLSTARPRLGDLLHLGVEIKRVENVSTSKGEKGTVEGEEEETKAALRRMRRVTVELFRRVIIHLPDPNGRTITHQTVLHASGKSLRYPGPPRPIRLSACSSRSPRFPTRLRPRPPRMAGQVSRVGGKVGVGGGAMGGVGVGMGVGVGGAGGRVEVGGGGDENDFVVEKEIEILPKIWSPLPPDQHHQQQHHQQQQQQQRATYQLQTQDGFAFDTPPELAAELSLNSSPSPYSSDADAGAEAAITDTLSARDAYRLKGRDIVGPSGTTRLPPPSSSGNAREGGGGEDDFPPPPFESSAESSAIDVTPTSLDGPGPGPSGGGYFGADVDEGQGSGLPSFLESEQQEERRARARAASLSDACLYALRGARGKEREASAGRSTAWSVEMRGGAAPVEGNGQGVEEEEGWSDDEELGVGREGLGGELATWIEYDGYETFSQPPPSLAASLHARGSMDPPQEGEEPLALACGVVGEVAARLGFTGVGVGVGEEGLELMEHLGLGEGTRIVDLQDDLPPGIDEPSLPALPSFTNQSHSRPHSHSHSQSHSRSPYTPPPPPHPEHVHEQNTIPIPTSPPPPHPEAAHPHSHPHSHPHDQPPAHDPPSFDASQAASAVGVAATSGPPSLPPPPLGLAPLAPLAPPPSSSSPPPPPSPPHHPVCQGGVSGPPSRLGTVEVGEQEDAPPDYERGGLPPYSQG